MAYSDANGENAQLLLRTITGLTNFAGRSRRTELIYFWIACALVGAILSFIVTVAVSLEASILFSFAFQLLLTIPTFALFVRRIHDQGKSGWWGLLLPLSLLFKLPRFVAAVRGDVIDIVAEKTSAVGILASLCSLAIIILCLLPGTNGANQFGPDPCSGEV